VLDEPSLGLAPKVIEQMYEALRELANGPMAILLSEQLVEMALRMADFGYVMENGKCVLDGTGVELLNDRAVKTAYL
jgi:branched-chain amino acid transport system ATP-binding protein